MQCRRCKEDVADAFRFCGYCGKSVSSGKSGFSIAIQVAPWIGGLLIAIATWTAFTRPAEAIVGAPSGIARGMYFSGDNAIFNGVVQYSGRTVDANEPYMSVRTAEGFEVNCYGGPALLRAGRGDSVQFEGRVAVWLHSFGGTMRNCDISGAPKGR